jgi:PHD/YefM family antitoxin component YafN of YafNO toxin-antitoxin module
MDIRKDICTVGRLHDNPREVIRALRTNRRPMVVADNGQPEFVIIPVTALKDKLTALRAACALAEIG